MKRLLVVVLLACAILFVPIMFSLILHSKPSVETWQPATTMKSVVHIEADAGWQGSGCYIGNGLILTAGHVVDGACWFKVTTEDGRVYESNESYLEPESDVGFIFVANIDLEPIRFDDDGYNLGDSVFVFGSPYGRDYIFSLSKGIVSNLHRDCLGFFGVKLMLQIDAAAYPGNSGGPVTDDEGEIIGILVGGTMQHECLSLCVPSNVCEQSMRIYLEILKMKYL